MFRNLYKPDYANINAMGKKGLSQIDWVISLAFFSIFVMLFFIFLNSRINMPVKSNSLLGDAETAFINDVSWTVEKTPVFSSGKGHAVLDFSLNNSLKYYFGGKCFSIDEGRFFYVSDELQFHNLFGSIKQAEPCVESLDLSQDSSTATTKNAGFQFDNGFLDRASYKSNINILDVAYQGELPQYNHTGNKVIAKYDAFSTSIHHKSYVISNGTGVFIFVDPSPGYAKTNFSLEFDATLKKYQSWYSYNGVVNSGTDSTGCKSLNNVTFLDFYDSDGVAFIFDNAKTDICFNDNNITMNVKISAFGETKYKIFFHEGDYKNAINATQSWLGMTSEIKGISEERLKNIINTSYSDIKARYNYPLTKDLAYEIYKNNSLIFRYDKSKKNTSSDVFVHGKQAGILDNKGNMESVEVFTKVW